MPRIKTLDANVARKIAAGEVIDRPAAIVRELMDNAVDSGANSITVEITGGGIERIRVIDNGCGMSKEDLESCARPHATSKIKTEEDLLTLSSLGFRGEALASMAAVSRLEILSGGYRMNASITEDHLIRPAASTKGTIVQTEALFENIPARRYFLKRPASEASQCRVQFEEKALPRPDIGFKLVIDESEKINLPKGQSLTERFIQTLGIFESEKLFYEIKEKASDATWSFTIILGEPSVYRPTRKNIYIYVNGRRIQEYSLLQAVEYGSEGYFPNGSHPVAAIFVQMDSSLVDFNIHPAKREARFKDIAPLHKAISSAVKNFYKKYTIKGILEENNRLDSEDKIQAQQKSLSYQIGHIPSSSSSSRNYRTFSDKRNSFFPKENTYNQEKIADIVSSTYGDLNILGESASASVPGKTTIPNYIQTEEDKDFHFVGQALGNFLIAEKDDTLYIIDQHAAHERYIYNEIMANANQKQPLLVPYIINSSSEADDKYLRELKGKFEEAGFTAKECGDGKWEFSTVPIRWKGNERDLERAILDKRIAPCDMINSIAASTACRMAVMAGDALDKETAAQIAREALLLPDPHCPHGRPVYTTITRRQLFMLVKRT